jgi:2-polyprenyl-3-methyl-5-hydroxy-6-metoxy-1,4-benzoquinol methylase
MDSKHISESGEYWKEHLLSWEASAYYKDTQHKANLWDRLSTVFRGDAMYVRMNAALELLRPYLTGKTVLDVGCASGRFAFQLLNAGAAKVYGIDISPEAIQIAEEHRAQARLEDRLDFSVIDIVHPENPLPKSDMVTALGVIEYFDPRAMSTFLGNLQAKYFFLDFPDIARRKQFPTWQLRQVYIRVNKLPGVYLYRLEEFVELARPFGFKNIWVAQRDGFYYVTNLPKP